MVDILDALDLLVVSNCMTPREALEKAYVAGHRKAVFEKDKPDLVVVDGGKIASNRE